MSQDRLRSANPGVEIQLYMGEPTWSDGHLVDLASGQEWGRRIRHHRIGPGRERDQKVAICVALKARHDTIVLPHFEAGAERGSARLIEAADRLRRAAVSGSFEAGRG